MYNPLPRALSENLCNHHASNKKGHYPYSVTSRQVTDQNSSVWRLLPRCDRRRPSSQALSEDT